MTAAATLPESGARSPQALLLSTVFLFLLLPTGRLTVIVATIL
jgi:hypothetical protein